MTTLDELSSLVHTLIDANNEVSKIECELKDAKERARFLCEESIPAVMQELELSNVTTNDGQKVSIKQEVYASITSENKEEAYNWLIENNFDGLIKTEIKIEYGRGEYEKAEKLTAAMQSKGLNAQLGQSVHAQTLKAFIKEQLSLGENFPLELFGARPTWTTKIK